MNTLSYHYIPNTDTYYFPDKDIYIKRWMFAYSDERYLAHILGMDLMSKSMIRRVFSTLAATPDKDKYTQIMHDDE